MHSRRHGSSQEHDLEVCENRRLGGLRLTIVQTVATWLSVVANRAMRLWGP
jgi:hypothetical protein